MAEFVSPLQKYLPVDFKGLVTPNHLGAMWMLEPHLISRVMENIYKVNVGDDLLSFMNQFPVKTVPTNRDIEWLLYGQDEKNIPLLGAYDLAGVALTSASTAGKNKSRFLLKFGENYFDPDHVIVGEKPDLYHVRIVSIYSQEATTVTYECELVTNDVNLYVPYEELVANTRWSIDYTLTEQDLSKRGTGVHHTSPFRMRTELSFMRKEYTVPGSMIDEGGNNPLAFDFIDQKGKQQTMWIKKLDYDFLIQFRREIARLLMFGKSNRLADGTYYNQGLSGYNIKAGMGLRDQIAPANIEYYNKFSLNHLVDFAMALSVGKLPEDSRRFVIGMGEYGLRTVSREIENTPSAQALAYGTTNRFSGNPSDMTYNTGQFTKVVSVQGIQFEFIHIPQYDDNVRNKVTHPTEGGLAESHRMTIMDFGTQSGEANIQRLVPKDNAEIFRYIPGLRDPFTAANGINPTMAASRVDGYEVHRAFTGGIMVKNPMRMGEFIPSVLR